MKHKIRIIALTLGGLASLLLSTFSFAAEAEKSAPKVQLPIGMNLAGISDYSPGYPFKNLMWGARPWMTKNLNGSGPYNTDVADKIPLEADGYPLSLPAKIDGLSQEQTVFTIIPNTVEPGRYVVLYDGDGDITVAMSSKVISQGDHRMGIELTKSGYQGIAITRSVEVNHLRNIRIVAEADEKADLAQNPFRADFLEYCKQWHSLRFMDWMATNGSLAKEWSTRKQPTFYTMVGESGDAIGRWGKPASAFQQRFGGGVPVEIMIQLANMTGTDPWFNMPHRATTEYMTEFAKLVKAKLDPKRHVYVEYSNEVWNWGFQQSGWMLQSKVAGDAVAAAGGNPWKKGVTPEFTLDDGMIAKDGGDSHPERIGALDRRCFECWEKVFPGSDRQRLIRVVGVQHAWTDTARRTAKWAVEHGGADAIAPAGYVGPNGDIYKRWATAGASLTSEQVIADMNEAFEKDSSKWTRAIGQIAKDYHLRYLVYEGGQHIQPEGQKELPYMPALKAAQFSQGMYDIYMRNLALHQEVGCELFMAFSSIGEQGSRWGSWGHQEFYGQPRSVIPKFGALLDANPPKN